MSRKDKTQEYISVGELSVGFNEYILQPTDALVGKKIRLYCESEKKATITFRDIETLIWEIEAKGCLSPYTAIMARKDIYFVDFIVSDGDSESISIILDMTQKIATMITGILPTAEEVKIPLIVRAEKRLPLTSVQVIFDHASVARPFIEGTTRHQKTNDLVGERFQWVYSSKDAYEHIYLNENLYTWHCIAGNEKGLADTDKCFYYKIDEKLYLFVWIEKIIPTIGIVLEDLEVMRSYGKIFGHEGFDMNSRITNFAVGSYGKFLNRTEYDLSTMKK